MTRKRFNCLRIGTWRAHEPSDAELQAEAVYLQNVLHPPAAEEDGGQHLRKTNRTMGDVDHLFSPPSSQPSSSTIISSTSGNFILFPADVWGAILSFLPIPWAVLLVDAQVLIAHPAASKRRRGEAGGLQLDLMNPIWEWVFLAQFGSSTPPVLQRMLSLKKLEAREAYDEILPLPGEFMGGRPDRESSTDTEGAALRSRFKVRVLEKGLSGDFSRLRWRALCLFQWSTQNLEAPLLHTRHLLHQKNNRKKFPFLRTHPTFLISARIRPFSQREVSVHMENKLLIRSSVSVRPIGPDHDRIALLEHTEDSHGFPVEREKRVFSVHKGFWSMPIEMAFSLADVAGEKDVWTELGTTLLEATFYQRRNACFFTLGENDWQTLRGAGDDDPGLILRYLNELMRLKQEKEENGPPNNSLLKVRLSMIGLDACYDDQLEMEVVDFGKGIGSKVPLVPIGDPLRTDSSKGTKIQETTASTLTTTSPTTARPTFTLPGTSSSNPTTKNSNHWKNVTEYEILNNTEARELFSLFDENRKYQGTFLSRLRNNLFLIYRVRLIFSQQEVSVYFLESPSLQQASTAKPIVEEEKKCTATSKTKMKFKNGCTTLQDLGSDAGDADLSPPTTISSLLESYVANRHVRQGMEMLVRALRSRHQDNPSLPWWKREWVQSLLEEGKGRRTGKRTLTRSTPSRKKIVPTPQVGGHSSRGSAGSSSSFSTRLGLALLPVLCDPSALFIGNAALSPVSESLIEKAARSGEQQPMDGDINSLALGLLEQMREDHAAGFFGIAAPGGAL